LELRKWFVFAMIEGKICFKMVSGKKLYPCPTTTDNLKDNPVQMHLLMTMET